MEYAEFSWFIEFDVKIPEEEREGGPIRQATGATVLSLNILPSNSPNKRLDHTWLFKKRSVSLGIIFMMLSDTFSGKYKHFKWTYFDSAQLSPHIALQPVSCLRAAALSLNTRPEIV